MIYIARELLINLTYLTLAGQNEDKELEWIGNDEQWNKVQWALDGSPVWDMTHPDHYKRTRDSDDQDSKYDQTFIRSELEK